MVRISDGRMSGTAAGTIILHVAPEAAIGGALAVVRTGDMISLDVENRQLNIEISEAELQQRLHTIKPKQIPASRGYAYLFHTHVMQAPDGVDFDFMQAEPAKPKK